MGNIGKKHANPVFYVFYLFSIIYNFIFYKIIQFFEFYPKI